MAKTKLYFLFRRGKKEHINALYENGDLYINSIDYIRSCDNNEERTDTDEGIKYRDFLGKAKITFCEIGKDFDKNGINFDAENVVLKLDYPQKGNIFCLTGVYSEDLYGERNDIHYQTKSFGESILFIYKPKIFLKRVHKELNKLGFKNHKSNKVIYYNNEYSGAINFFMKNEKFKAQNEFRIFIPNEYNEPLKINIGPMKDIATTQAGFVKIIHKDDKEQLLFL